MPRKLYEIGNEIANQIHDGKWSRGASAAARPYLAVLCTLDDVNSLYGAENGKSMVLYFLVNTQSWRGATARRIKAELKELVK